MVDPIGIYSDLRFEDFDDKFNSMLKGRTLEQIQNDVQEAAMNSTPLHQKKCLPCQGGVPPLKGNELASFLARLPKGWEVIREHHLRKEFHFPNFQKALDFTNQVGKIAEEEGHHPDIYLSWGKVVLEIWTHKIDGLTESDFILAAKCSVN